MSTPRSVLHVDVNNAFLSWSAVKMLEEGAALDVRTVPSVVGGDETARRGIVLARSQPAKAYGIQTGEPLCESVTVRMRRDGFGCRLVGVQIKYGAFPSPSASTSCHRRPRAPTSCFPLPVCFLTTYETDPLSACSVFVCPSYPSPAQSSSRWQMRTGSATVPLLTVPPTASGASMDAKVWFPLPCFAPTSPISTVTPRKAKNPAPTIHF